MTTKTISIIGGRGKMGNIFAKAFTAKGYSVIISGRETEISPIEAAKKGDIVIVTIPISETEEIIKKIGPHVRTDALLTDFTSVKVYPCEAMKKYSKAEVIGGHPVFGPTVTFNKQNFVLCPIRGDKYLTWYKEFLSSLDINVTVMTPEEHDKQMAVIQCLNQLSNFAFGRTLQKLNFNIQSKITSPSYLLKLYGLGRVLDQDPGLYADIEVQNPYSKEVAAVFTKSAQELEGLIKKNNKTDLEKTITEIKKYFGQTKKATEITNEMLKTLNSKK
ncbi:MAG: prephenate dehydrogenase/arogenate dehydrogenase family protein [Nanoarchaeota archaeon]|nr:prephenate dehydrogenase/arogenate dehydrogenase family protein [Nanoarchaeota archaeon]